MGRFPFLALIKLGDFSSRVEAELDASKRFGASVVRVQSEADHREEEIEQQSARRMHRRED